jgi:hypothetical protein
LAPSKRFVWLFIHKSSRDEIEAYYVEASDDVDKALLDLSEWHQDARPQISLLNVTVLAFPGERHVPPSKRFVAFTNELLVRAGNLGGDNIWFGGGKGRIDCETMRLVSSVIDIHSDDFVDLAEYLGESVSEAEQLYPAGVSDW